MALFLDTSFKDDFSDLSAVQAVGELRFGNRMTVPESCYCPSELKKLMEKCWAQLPSDRPDFEKICETLEKIY